MKPTAIETVLIRMDRMGDLVLSLPADSHPALGGQNVHWLITKGLGFIAEQAQPRRAYTEFSRRFSVFELVRMVRWFKTQKPLQVVILHAPWWVSLAAWMAGIPIRIGRKSQWHSFLFLNLGVRQSRSTGEKHESEYNFELVERAFCRLGVRSSADFDRILKAYLDLSPPNPSGTLPAKNLGPRNFRVVHPGMGGSALNWPAEYYIELIEDLAKDSPVVVTGTNSDLKFLTPIKEAVSQRDNVRWLINDLNGRELLDVLSQARSVVAPSTGVLHLAAALGTPTFGIYSPRKTEHPARWAPRGSHTQVICPETGPDASVKINASIMREVKVGEVLSQLKNLEKTSSAS